MASGSALQPNQQFTTVGKVDATQLGVVWFYGSFQGFVTSTSNYLPQNSRGTYFTVTWVATGQYRIAINLNLPWQVQPNGVAYDNGNLPGNPAGFIQEPQAHVLSETTQTAPLIPTARATRIDKVNSATLNTFDIFTFNSSGAAADVTSADRVQFAFAYKLTGFNP